MGRAHEDARWSTVLQLVAHDGDGQPGNGLVQRLLQALGRAWRPGRCSHRTAPRPCRRALEARHSRSIGPQRRRLLARQRGRGRSRPPARPRPRAWAFATPPCRTPAPVRPRCVRGQAARRGVGGERRAGRGRPWATSWSRGTRKASPSFCRGLRGVLRQKSSTSRLDICGHGCCLSPARAGLLALLLRHLGQLGQHLVGMRPGRHGKPRRARLSR